MSYQIDYFMALKALFTPVVPAFFLIVAGSFIIPVGLIASNVRKKTNIWNHGIVCLVSFAIFCLLVFVAPWQSVGAGWQLGEDELTLTAWPVSETIELARMKIMLTDSGDAWKPILRTNGYGTPGLSTGWFKLANGEKAAVFYHAGSDKMLVIQANERYYLIAHPGVGELYQYLIAKGVEKGDF